MPQLDTAILFITVISVVLTLFILLQLKVSEYLNLCNTETITKLYHKKNYPLNALLLILKCSGWHLVLTAMTVFSLTLVILCGTEMCSFVCQKGDWKINKANLLFIRGHHSSGKYLNADYWLLYLGDAR